MDADDFFSICNVLSGFSKLYTDFRRIPNRFLKAFQFVNECPLQWLVSHGCATYRLQWGTSLPSCSTSWALVMLLRLPKKKIALVNEQREYEQNRFCLTLLAACFWGFLHSDQKIGSCGPQMFLHTKRPLVMQCNAWQRRKDPEPSTPASSRWCLNTNEWGFQCWLTDVCSSKRRGLTSWTLRRGSKIRALTGEQLMWLRNGLRYNHGVSWLETKMHCRHYCSKFWIMYNVYHIISNSVSGWLLVRPREKSYRHRMSSMSHQPGPHFSSFWKPSRSFVFPIFKVFQLIVSDWDQLRVMEIQKTQDYEDEHGSPKSVQQQVLLPHEIFGTLLLQGELDRLTGGSEASSNFTVIGG